MGCFLACFGSSKERESRKQRHKVRPRTRHQTHGSYKPVDATAIESDHVETPKKFATSLLRDDKSEEQLTLSARKKVTFDLNVTTYEHISDSEVEDEKTGESISKTEEKEEEEKAQLENSGHPHSNAVPMSIKSHPPNNRYLNCRDTEDDNYEDETEEFEDDDSESDLDDMEYYNNSIENQPPPWVVESRNVNPTNISALVNHGPESMQLKRIIRDRSAYVHPVLNPVENLTQWKALKAGGPPPQLKQKLEEEPKHEEELCFSYRPKRDRRARNEEEEVAVDASLSSWLGAAASDHNSTSSVSTTPVRSFDDRPILGALTVEELRQFSASSSPAKRSPCRSAEEEAPIIGSVGGYWGQQQQPTQVTKDSSPVSFKGIPNTTSKYREDKVVNWHSTPFEARLERALTRGGVAVDA